MVYDWKIQMPVDAQSAGEFMEGLERKNGTITPKLVLDSSRRETDLLHPCFEWNDGAAAELYRESQARHLIGNLITVNVESPEPHKQQPVRAFVNVTENPKGKGAYVAVNTALNDSEMRNTVLKHAMEELMVFKRKYSTLAELSGVIAEIEKLEKE